MVQTVASVALVMMVVGIVSIPTSLADPPAQVAVNLPGALASCLGKLTTATKTNRAIIDFPSALDNRDGIALASNTLRTDAAYLDYQSELTNNGVTTVTYIVTGYTTQFACAMLASICPNPPSDESILAWSTEAVDAIVQVRVEGIPPPPSCVG